MVKERSTGAKQNNTNITGDVSGNNDTENRRGSRPHYYNSKR